MTGGVARELSGMHRNTAPSEALHVRHWRVIVLLRAMDRFLFQNAEHSAGSFMAFCPSTYGRSADHDSVAINVHLLFGNTDEDHERTPGRDFRMQPIFAG